MDGNRKVTLGSALASILKQFRYFVDNLYRCGSTCVPTMAADGLETAASQPQRGSLSVASVWGARVLVFVPRPHPQTILYTCTGYIGTVRYANFYLTHPFRT